MIENRVKSNLEAHRIVFEKVSTELVDDICRAAELACNTIEKNKKILLFGNGGSASDAQHIAAEMTGRFRKERRGLPAIALTTDTSALTAIGNDYGFENIFARQVEALAVADDLCIGISTSGNSSNVLTAIKRAQSMGCKTIGLSGKGGGDLKQLCDINLIAPDNDTARIQEMHILIGHILCDVIDHRIS